MTYCYYLFRGYPYLFILLILSVSLTFDVKGQSMIKGQIENENGVLLPYATVLLLSPADSSLIKGVVTTENGTFEINDVTAGDYLLSAQTVGYTPTYSSGFTIIDQPILVLKTLQLNEKVTELGEVVIAATKPLFEQQIDRLVVNVQSSITASSGTVLEVLERSPSVMVDHYNSALRMNGKNGVQVMVNGKLSRMPMEALYQMLSSMQATNIEKIELITTPPANFDAEGDAGYINIVLKTSEGEGINGSLFANTGKGRKFNRAFGGDINIRKNKLIYSPIIPLRI